MKRLATAGVVVALLAGGCSSGSGPDPVGTLTPLGGRIEILAGERWSPVTEQIELAPGDQVRSDASGSARLQLSEHGQIELGHLSRVRMSSVGESELMGGSVLAQGSNLSVQVGRVVARPREDGAFRVERALSTRVGNYRGYTELAALGGPVTVPPLSQAIVVAHAVPAAPSPLQVDPHDAWDRMMLGDAVDIGLELSQLERRVPGELGGADAAQTFALALPNQVTPERIHGLMNAYPATAGRVFLSLAVASSIASAGPVLPVARGILSRLDRGASWIVVVAGLDAVRATLVAAVARILGSIPGLLSQTAGGPPRSPGTTDPTIEPRPSTTPPTTPPTDDPCGAGGSTCPAPCADGDTVCETVNQVIDRVGGGGGTGGLPPPPTGL
jgi:hypothetical protein